MARDMKPIIHIDGGLHASEVANHQHTIQLGYDLVASEEPEFQTIRKDLIVELWFSINPDGQNIVAEWYRQNVGTPYEVSPLPVALPGVRGARQQSRRLHAEHAGVARNYEGDARDRAADLLHAAPKRRRSPAAYTCRRTPTRSRATCTR